MLITKKDLPLNQEYLKKTKDFCGEKITSGGLYILGDIDPILRQDYLDETLPLPDRAIKNINVSSEDWRNAMIKECYDMTDKIITEYGKNLFVVYPWRAAWPFIFGFSDYDIKKHCHIGMKRNEEQPDKTEEIWMDLDKNSFENLDTDDKVILADPMFATGGSLYTVIKKIIDLGVNQNQIITANIVTAPEGVYNILNKYSQIIIFTKALDDCLNEIGYIKPGLGDAGDKFCHQNYLSFFDPVRHTFNENEWGELENRIIMANAA